ncbi:MAG: glutathione transport system ATP-binding protein [Frankiales bacterium]|jgi:oligopeptide/dipeptide ABC transporter ATP-binding protein|nr:glutathione transport system ATP-binding protein [Frankiales bacterium]MDX6210316.1 glutathione transport system ATP-binding protein [Frankiales bacterium]
MTLVDIGNEPTEALDPNVVLSVRDLKVQFPTEDGVVHAVRGVSYDLHAGEVLGIVGESGSGKSVTSLTIMGLLPRSAQVSGSIKFGKTELVGASEKRLNEVRGRNIAMIFQDPMTSLNPVYSIGYQIAEAVRAHRGVSKAKALDRAVELLDIVGIPRARERVDSYPHEFSGGMRQRVVIAIAMANNPDVIIADEPTTALDVTVQAQVLEALGRAREATGAAMVLITHDLGVVAGQADRVLVMYAGRPVEIAKVDDVYYRPRMPYTLGLLGSMPRLDATTRQERLTPIAGSPPSMLHLPDGCPFTPRCPMARELCEHSEPDLRPTTSAEHLSACHFSAELEGSAANEVFEAGIVDDVPAGPGPDPRDDL